MIAGPGRDDPGQGRTVAAVLTGRIASSLVHHAPGWRLPRNTTLARRYNVSTAQIDAAIRELAARNVLRRLPDGQVYQASPAEYLITLDGLPSIGSRIDPMGASITRASQHESHRRIPQDIALALGLRPGQQATIIRCLWKADGQPAALSTTYLPAPADAGAAHAESVPASLNAALNSQTSAGQAAARPTGMCVELQPPVPSVARSLRLAPGEPAITVTVAFTGLPGGHAAALTTAVLRPGLFRVVVESAPGALRPALSHLARTTQSQAR